MKLAVLQRAGRRGACAGRRGADGFVLFNRFYQPDIDLVTMRVQRDLVLSAVEMRLPLLWIACWPARSALVAASTGWRPPTRW